MSKEISANIKKILSSMKLALNSGDMYGIKSTADNALDYLNDDGFTKDFDEYMKDLFNSRFDEYSFEAIDCINTIGDLKDVYGKMKKHFANQSKDMKKALDFLIKKNGFGTYDEVEDLIKFTDKMNLHKIEEWLFSKEHLKEIISLTENMKRIDAIGVNEVVKEMSQTEKLYRHYRGKMLSGLNEFDKDMEILLDDLDM